MTLNEIKQFQIGFCLLQTGRLRTLIALKESEPLETMVKKIARKSRQSSQEPDWAA